MPHARPVNCCGPVKSDLLQDGPAAAPAGEVKEEEEDDEDDEIEEASIFCHGRLRVG